MFPRVTRDFKLIDEEYLYATAGNTNCGSDPT